MVGIDVSKSCKPKNLRRIILALLLFAPLVYLFGTQFFALNGAHGEEVLAVETTREEIDYDVVYDDVTYKRYFYTPLETSYAVFKNPDEGYFGIHLCFGIFGINYIYCYLYEVVNVPLAFYDGGLFLSGEGSAGFVAVESLYSSTLDSYCLSFVVSDLLDEHFNYVEVFFDDALNFSLLHVYDNLSELWYNYSSFDLWNYDNGTDYLKLIFNPFVNPAIDESRYIPAYQPVIQVPIEGTSSNYSDTLQNHFFNQNNWVSSIGRDVYAAEEVGFTPFGSMIRFVDENALHLEGTEWGDFLAGYAYYCGNVVFFYEICAIAIMVITIPMRFLDSFQKGE